MELRVKDLGEHFLVPREDFYDLATSAFKVDPTVRDRIGQSLQSTTTFVSLTGCAIVGFWSYYKAKDWHDQRKFLRQTGTDPEAIAEPIPFKK